MGRFVAGVIVLALALGTVAFVRGEVPCDVLAVQPSCEVALGPGPTENALGLVTVEGAPSFPSDGELRMTTIAVQDRLTVRSWLRGRTSPVVEVVPREEIYPRGSGRDEVDEYNAVLMEDSQLVATIAALTRLGFEIESEGALVAGVTDDAVTEELDTGDVIVTIDGAQVTDSEDVVAAVQASAPGDTLRLGVINADGARDVEVTLGAASDDRTPYIGVLLTTELDLPVDITIDAGAIGGPSAGMMFALSIIELLGKEDLTGGTVIAGTGTVDRDGVVGAVGGVRQKVVGATTVVGDSEPASVFLVPRDNLEDARFAPVTEEVQVVPVDTIDDALAAMAAVRADRVPRDALIVQPRT